MKNSLKQLFTYIKDQQNRKDLLKVTATSIVNLPKSILLFTTFFILLIIFIVQTILKALVSFPLVCSAMKKIKMDKVFSPQGLVQKLVLKLEAIRPFKVRRYYLISLAFNNLKIKKSRSLITIFGMSVGVGIIVYLLSLGYGIERMVISRVARLDELKITDVIPGETGDVKITDSLIKRIKRIETVENVLPMVLVVGKVNYKNAKTDILAYAVTDDYMDVLNTRLIKGKLFADKGDYLSYDQGEVQGAQIKLVKGVYQQPITQNQVKFNIKPQQAVIAWSDCSVNSKILGYTTRVEGGYFGQEYWGGEYAPYYPNGRVGYDEQNELHLGRWLKTKVLLYNKLLDNKLQPVLEQEGKHVWEDVCLQKKGLVVEDEFNFATVLGEATGSASVATSSDDVIAPSATEAAALNFDVVVVSTGSGGLELVALEATESAGITQTKKEQETLKFKEAPHGHAVISLGMANFLSIPLKDAINSKFKVSFILVKNLMGKESGKLVTEEVIYEIVGVTDEENEEFFYIPLSDIQKASVRNYSQLKVVTGSKKDLAKLRQEVETLGVVTSSAVDTVAQIESLFVNVRLLLGLLGTIALGVAALGMFNTLTVSLLERTREIGGMKTMGMVSEEIQELFLSEAMIMGFAGGIGGLVLGILAGELTSLLISIVAISQGSGYLKLSFVPLFLIIFILLSSFVVGVITGLYPAQKAKKTSALNALRYE